MSKFTVFTDRGQLFHQCSPTALGGSLQADVEHAHIGVQVTPREAGLQVGSLTLEAHLDTGDLEPSLRELYCSDCGARYDPATDELVLRSDRRPVQCVSCGWTGRIEETHILIDRDHVAEDRRHAKFYFCPPGRPRRIRVHRPRRADARRQAGLPGGPDTARPGPGDDRLPPGPRPGPAVRRSG